MARSGAVIGVWLSMILGMINAFMKKEYEIKTLSDFLKIPNDRIDDCLAEFKVMIETAKEHSDLVIINERVDKSVVKPAEIGAFTLKDDWENNCGHWGLVKYDFEDD